MSENTPNTCWAADTARYPASKQTQASTEGLFIHEGAVWCLIRLLFEMEWCLATAMEYLIFAFLGA